MSNQERESSNTGRQVPFRRMLDGCNRVHGEDQVVLVGMEGVDNGNANGSAIARPEADAAAATYDKEAANQVVAAMSRRVRGGDKAAGIVATTGRAGRGQTSGTRLRSSSEASRARVRGSTRERGRWRRPNMLWAAMWRRRGRQGCVSARDWSRCKGRWAEPGRSGRSGASGARVH